MTKALPIKTALVTGATEGIGQATAWAMADAGHDVIVTDLETGSLAETISGIEAKGRRALGLPLDLRQEASITAALEKAVQMCGPIGLLVNNAGCTLNKPAIDVGWSEWDQVMDVNLKGSYFLTTRFAARCIAEGRAGIVISVASTHGLVGIADRSVYSISKGGLVQMTRALAIEWASADIRVNAVAPGTVLTPSRARLLADPARRQRMLDRIPIARFPSAEEVAAAIAYLASPLAAAVTGQILPVDGGITAY
jgi:NAD(P)-dependent dehydrogenase (short-subunit alcohol dehydrogenase family)